MLWSQRLLRHVGGPDDCNLLTGLPGFAGTIAVTKTEYGMKGGTAKGGAAFLCEKWVRGSSDLGDTFGGTERPGGDRGEGEESKQNRDEHNMSTDLVCRTWRDGI